MSSSDERGPPLASQPAFTLIVTCQRERDKRRDELVEAAMERGDGDEVMRLVSETTAEPTEEHDCDECRLVRAALAAEGGHDD